MAETKRVRAAVARLAGVELPRRRFTGVGSSAAPGLDSARDRVREAVCTMANPPGHSKERVRARVRHAAARGGPRSPASRGNVVPTRNWVKLCYWKQPCGTGELLWCLTRPMVSQGGGSTTAWRRCQATARKSTRAEGGKKGKRVGEAPHQRIVLQGSAAIGSQRCSGGFGVVQRWSTSLLRGDSRRAGVGVGAAGLERRLGARRSHCAALAGLGGGEAAWPRRVHGDAEARRGRAAQMRRLGLKTAAAGWRGRAQGRARGLKGGGW